MKYLKKMEKQVVDGKGGNMKLLTIILLIAQLGACSTRYPTKSHPIVKGSQSLGFGFKRVGMAEAVSVSFESVGHFDYLYYKKQKLCRLGDVSVSPSGNYALYQEASTGNLFLFRRVDRNITQLTDQPLGLLELVRWEEGAGTVTVKLTKKDQTIFKEFQIDNAQEKKIEK